MAPPLNSPLPVAGTLQAYGPCQAVLKASGAIADATRRDYYFSPGPDKKIVTVTVVTTVLTAAAVVTLAVEVYDEASETWIALVASPTTVTATGTLEYSVGPNAVAVTGLSAPTALGPFLRVSATGADTKSVTYSIGVRAS